MFKQVQIYLLSFVCVYYDHSSVVWLVATLEWNASGNSESRYWVAGGWTPLLGVLNYVDCTLSEERFKFYMGMCHFSNAIFWYKQQYLFAPS